MLRFLVPGAAALMFALSAGAPASAVTTFSFTAQPEDPGFAGLTGTGTVTYDETLLSGGGFEFLSPSEDPLLAITFTLFGQDFSITDDVEFPNAPQVEFVDFVPVGLSFIIFDQTATDPNVIDDPLIESIFVQGDLVGSIAGGFETQFAASAREVSLPGALGLLLSALGATGLLLLGRRSPTAAG